MHIGRISFFLAASAVSMLARPSNDAGAMDSTKGTGVEEARADGQLSL
jgi:hypothetical protein